MSHIYKSILIKLSGELLSNNGKSFINKKIINYIISDIKYIIKKKIKIGIVIGGGNIFRGINSTKFNINRIILDKIGMLATIINALTLQEILNNIGIKSYIQSSLNINGIVENNIQSNIIKNIEKNKVIIFAGGIGNPFFTTDTTAILKAFEINANAILKATKVKGVYSDDPNKNPNAKFYKKISFNKIINKNIKIIDKTALILCKDKKIPIHIFSMKKKNIIKKIINGKNKGTIIH